MEGITSELSSISHPLWIELPSDVTANILIRLGPMEMMESAQKVCTTWWRVCGEPSLWQVIQMKSPYRTNDVYHKEVMVCRRAVDRSRGELIEISIQRFGNDDLLQYISDRSSHLKCLRIDHCYAVSARGLTEALKKLPLLEELHLIVRPFICAVDIETISVSCPLLKSFSFNSYGNLMMKTDDSLAVAIAKSMPDLCRLSIFGDNLSNEGLEAILDGCPNLESLDLRHCNSVDLKSEIGRRCSEHIKELRCPFDSIDDCDWFDQSLDYLSYVDELGDRMADYDADYDDDQEIDFDFTALDFSDMLKSEDVELFMEPFKNLM